MPLNLSPTQIAFNARGDGSFNKPFPEQLEFFRQKLNLPTEHYDDILRDAHDRAFVVAGATKADLLNDFREAIERAEAGQITFSQWKKDFRKIVEKNGWQGWTGSDTKAGRAWRARVIYQTNLATSYAAGRYAQMDHPDVVKRRPYLKYLHNDNVLHPRPLHLSWNGLVLAREDPWWQAHRPPNGYGCQCRIVAVTADEYHGQKAPEDGAYIKVDRYGQKHEIPAGVDYGFDYTPGEGVDAALRQMVQKKLLRYPAAIARAMSRDINNQISASKSIVDFVNDALRQASKEMFLIGFIDDRHDRSMQGYPVLLPSGTVRHVQKSHRFDGGAQRPVNAEDYRRLASLLSDPDRIDPGLASRLSNPTLIYQKKIGEEWYRAVFEVFAGPKNRNLRLLSFLVGRGG